MRHRLLCVLAVLGLVMLLSACGGGSGDPNSPHTPQPARSGSAWALGKVLVQVADTSGQPVVGAVVSMVRSTGDYVDLQTNTQGEALFNDVPVGATAIRAEEWGYYRPPTRDVQVVENQQALVAFALEPRNPATLAVLGSRVISKGEDRQTLEFEVDVGVLDESGQPLTNLVDAAFRLPQIDCGWGPCLVAPTRWIDAWYDAGAGHPQAFTLEPARNRPPVAAGILLDQGDGMRSSEPRRSAALGEFLATLTGSDSVLLAEYRGAGGEFEFAPSGGFVTDGRTLLSLVSGLRDRIDDRASDSVKALESMLSHLDQQPAPGPKALVAVSRGNAGCDEPGASQGWDGTCGRPVERSRALGIPITTMAGSFSLAGADLARRTGGASFVIDFPAQYRTALRGLLPVVGGGLPFYRVRFKVIVRSSEQVDLLAEGNTLYAYLEVRLSERDTLYADVVVPL